MCHRQLAQILNLHYFIGMGWPYQNDSHKQVTYSVCKFNYITSDFTYYYRSRESYFLTSCLVLRNTYSFTRFIHTLKKIWRLRICVRDLCMGIYIIILILHCLVYLRVLRDLTVKRILESSKLWFKMFLEHERKKWRKIAVKIV